MSDSYPPEVGDAIPRIDLDAAVADVWAEELGVPSVGVDTDLVTLGCTMGAARRLRARIREDFQVHLPDNAVYPSQTVIGLADQIIAHRRDGRQHPTLVTLRRSGSRPPLFCLSGSAGYAFNFLSLTRALGPDQPVHAMHASGLERRGRPDWTVSGHARRHLTTVRKIQPTGPYLLLGHSFGGLIALEMAQQLRAEGDEVAHLALIDPPLPAPTPAPSAEGNFSEDVAIAFQTYMRFTGPRGKVKIGAFPFLGLVRFPGRHNTDLFWLSTQISLDLYQIKPHQGRITLYRPEQKPHAPEQWSRLLPADTRQISVPGDHETVMRAVNVGALAADLTDQLRLAAGSPTARANQPDGSR